jgi:hypothetical protein
MQVSTECTPQPPAANEALEAIGAFLVDRLNGFRIAETGKKEPS